MLHAGVLQLIKKLCTPPQQGSHKIHFFETVKHKKSHLIMLAVSLLHFQEPHGALRSASFNSEASDDFSVARSEATKLSRKRLKRHRKRLTSSQIHYNSSSSRSLGSASDSSTKTGSNDDGDDSSVASCDKTVQVSNVNNSIASTLDDAFWLLTVFGCDSPAPR